MTTKIYAGQRILYKKNGGWRVGTLLPNGATLNEKGLFFSVMDNETKEMISELNLDNLFLDGRELQDWVRDRDNGMLFTKEEFIEMIEDEDFDPRSGEGYMSDGEYEYYRVSHFNRNWIERQDLDYIVWYT